MAESKTPRVYGDRTCPTCRGLCHEGSWRRKWGQRKRYYCCERHLRGEYEGRLQANYRKSGIWWKVPEMTDEEWAEIRNEFYERVDVICK